MVEKGEDAAERELGIVAYDEVPLDALESGETVDGRKLIVSANDELTQGLERRGIRQARELRIAYNINPPARRERVEAAHRLECVVAGHDDARFADALEKRKIPNFDEAVVIEPTKRPVRGLKRRKGSRFGERAVILPDERNVKPAAPYLRNVLTFAEGERTDFRERLEAAHRLERGVFLEVTKGVKPSPPTDASSGKSPVLTSDGL